MIINLTLPNFAAIVSGLGQCVVEGLEQTPAGAPCRRCFLLPTQSIPMDNCGPCLSCDGTTGGTGGQVALAIQQVFSSDVFPQPVGKSWVAGCGPRLWVAQVLVSVTRCVPTMGEDGEPPSCAAELAAAITLENDRSAVRQALACCLYALHAGRPPVVTDFMIGPSVTVGESGGCAGVETVVYIGALACTCQD